jgi:hypothetical protein
MMFFIFGDFCFDSGAIKRIKDPHRFLIWGVISEDPHISY